MCLFLNFRKTLNSHMDSVLEGHLLTASFRQQYFLSPFDPLNVAKRRKITSAGELLDILLDTIALVYPGYMSQAMEIPDRLQLPMGSHPFPGRVSIPFVMFELFYSYNLKASMVSEDEPVQAVVLPPVPLPAPPLALPAQPVALPAPPLALPAQPVALPPVLRVLNLNSCEADIEFVAEQILTYLASSPNLLASKDEIKVFN
jgi:hypothetical protein